MNILKRKQPDYIKRICILLIMLISFFAIIIQPTYTYCANASIIEITEDLDKSVDNMLNDIDFAPIEQVVSEFDNNQVSMFSLGNIKDKITSVINGEQAVNYNTIVEVILQILLQVIVQYVPMFALIVGIGIRKIN